MFVGGFLGEVWLCFYSSRSSVVYSRLLGTWGSWALNISLVCFVFPWVNWRCPLQNWDPLEENQQAPCGHSQHWELHKLPTFTNHLHELYDFISSSWPTTWIYIYIYIPAKQWNDLTQASWSSCWRLFRSRLSGGPSHTLTVPSHVSWGCILVCPSFVAKLYHSKVKSSSANSSRFACIRRTELLLSGNQLHDLKCLSHFKSGLVQICRNTNIMSSLEEETRGVPKRAWVWLFFT